MPGSDPSLGELLRSVPAGRSFDRAVSRLRRGELWRACELDPGGPIYFVPTKEFVGALARWLGRSRVLEVAAGEGVLARALARRGVRIVATDSGRWERPQARMNAAEKRRFRGRSVAGLRLGEEVLWIDAIEAIRKFEPDLVIACWIPPGPLLGRIIRAAPKVIDIGAEGGVTGEARAAHQVLDELAALGRCRLDERPALELHTRVTLYERRAPRRRG